MLERTAWYVPSEIQQEHASILEILDGLERAFEPEANLGLPHACHLLNTAYSRIVSHFRSEESAGGWMDGLRRLEPEFAFSVQQFAGEHRQLQEALETLMEDVNASPTMDDAFREKALRWIQRLREHESREDELIEEAHREDSESW